MEINYNPKVGEMYDFFNFFYWINQYEERENRYKELGVELEEKHKNFLLSFKEDNSLDREKIKFYFNKDTDLAKVFLCDFELWSLSSLDDCFDFILKLNAKALKSRLIKQLLKDLRNGGTEEQIAVESMEISENDDKILCFIKELDIDSAGKWDLFCFIQEPEKYRDEYLDIMKNFAEVFHKVYDTRKKVIGKFSDYIERNIKKEGFDFLNKIARNIFKYHSFDKVHLTPSYTNYYCVIYSVIENSCYIFLGVGFEETVEKFAGKEDDKFRRHLNVYKNFSDRTRFEILKLITENEEYCSKDIAKKLIITGATVSYHMNYLFSAGIIQIDRKNRKNIYTINKGVIRESIDYLIKEFKL